MPPRIVWWTVYSVQWTKEKWSSIYWAVKLKMEYSGDSSSKKALEMYECVKECFATKHSQEDIFNASIKIMLISRFEWVKLDLVGTDVRSRLWMKIRIGCHWFGARQNIWFIKQGGAKGGFKIKWCRFNFDCILVANREWHSQKIRGSLQEQIGLILKLFVR